MTVFASSASMAVDLMEREPCRGCHHLHRYPLVPKCSCCRADYKALDNRTKANLKRRYLGLDELPEEEATDAVAD